MKSCIVGVGEPLAGDDAVGVRVVERLERGAALGDVELFALRDPSDLTAILPGRPRALVVDALLAPGRAGTVELFSFEHATSRPAALGRSALSSHGVDTLTAIALAEQLARGEAFPRVSVLTIAIARPNELGVGLTPSAERGVELAVARALAWSTEVSRAAAQLADTP